MDTPLKQYNAVADEVMMAGAVPIIDLFGFTMDFGALKETQLEGVHFQPATSCLQAAFIAGWLERFGATA